jgi:hypothetical protein
VDGAGSCLAAAGALWTFVALPCPVFKLHRRLLCDGKLHGWVTLLEILH